VSKCNFTLIAFNKGYISLISILIFDENMMGSWRICIHLKGVGKLRFRVLNVTELIKTKLFP
jgi:hypothetical protein